MLARVSDVKSAVALRGAQSSGRHRLGILDLCATVTRASTSVWRHAIINFAHPLLQQGLVLLDTPGLNAVGANRSSRSNSAERAVIVFVIAADAGV